MSSILLKRSLKNRVREFLREHQIGVLATASPLGRPHASVIYYMIDDDLNVSFITKKQTLKSQNIEANNRVEMVVYDEFTQSTAEIFGEVERVDDTMQSSEAFRNALKTSLRTAESAIPPISKLNAGDYVAYKLSPLEIRIATFKRRSTDQPKGVFETYTPLQK